MSTEHRCGTIAIVGRPNVGKSTLLNRVLGQKISITSRKPQTTRHRIVGIHTRPGCQAVYVDTPGLNQGETRAINRSMNRAALSAMREVDVAVLVVEAGRWTKADEAVLQPVIQAGVPVILAVNKIDKLAEREALLPFLQDMQKRADFAEYLPLSALKGDNVEALSEVVARYLPVGEAMYPEEMPTDRSERFMVSELIREKIMRRLGQELPYSAAVEIERFEDQPRLTEIHALILVERDGQKKILIGRGGDKLKQIGSEARADIEQLLQRKVLLKLWVKVRSGWSDDLRALRSLGYEDV